MMAAALEYPEPERNKGGWQKLSPTQYAYCGCERGIETGV